MDDFKKVFVVGSAKDNWYPTPEQLDLLIQAEHAKNVEDGVVAVAEVFLTEDLDLDEDLVREREKVLAAVNTGTVVIIESETALSEVLSEGFGI